MNENNNNSDGAIPMSTNKAYVDTCTSNETSHNNNIIENGNIYDDILIRVAKVDDQEAILNFLRLYYYPEEPLTIGNEPKLQSTEDEMFSVSVLPYGASVIACNRKCNNQIVGALLAGPVGPDEADEIFEEAKHCTNKKWTEILRLLGHLEQNSNVYERYNVDKALHIHVMGVDPQMRGKAIGKKLMKKCMEIGKNLQFPMVTLDCTSIYSIKIAEYLEMDCVGVLAYTDYKDIDGRQIFCPPLPHTHVKTFAKRL